jgi:alpha-L-fucosidase 2
VGNHAAGKNVLTFSRTHHEHLKGLTIRDFTLTPAAHSRDTVSTPDSYNVVWNTPSVDENGSMPIGNGDIGANVWVEDGGDLLFYVSKTDALSENMRFLKLGRVRVTLNPNPFEKGCSFKQELDLTNGVINITSVSKSNQNLLNLKFWIDANNPVIRVEADTSKDTKVSVQLEMLRNKRTQASDGDISFGGLKDRDKRRRFSYPVFVEPDTLHPSKDNTLVWYHRNKKGSHSVWEDSLKVQGLEEFMKKSKDPLLNLTFGAQVQGTGLLKSSAMELKSQQPTKHINISVHPLTDQSDTAKIWLGKLKKQVKNSGTHTAKKAQWLAHKKWWHDFWQRSWINITAKPGEDAYVVARGYALQNWVTACGGRGSMPIKFNGSIFTVNTKERGRLHGPDYRAWGSAYWWQNTRLPYWPMLASGHYEMLQPLFKMYSDALPLAKHRIKKYYNFEGAYFPETMFPWGTYRNEDYGWNPKKGRHPDRIRGHHTQYYWQSGIELTAMMLEYYDHTGDRNFLNKKLLPMAKEIVAFYDQRYKRNAAGKLVIYPANALEDVFHCTNPTPEIAGLKYVLPQLIKLCEDKNLREKYKKLLTELPDIESAVSESGQKYLLPARKDVKRRGNCEKPECYAIFPYRLYGVGLPDLALAKETFKLSPREMEGQDRSNGWAQDPIFAACVGNVDEVKKLMIQRMKRYHKESRFPGFWGPDFNWVPDQDHGGVNCTALQKMLLQTEPYSNKIHLLAAWPKDWDCSFKLHAPYKTTVQGEVKNGKLINLIVSPASRKKDVINYLK